jgi:uncharacterized repeat protein (TIGR03803 family)
LILDKSGNVFGTTQFGGNPGCFDNLGCGTVFELIPNNGKWTEKVLHSFCSAKNCTDGSAPIAGLILDGKGNLYGTTEGGGIGCRGYGCGTVFQLTPGKDGQWREKVLYSFSGSSDGSGPFAGLIFDGKGNLYGTTFNGGTYASGTVFQLRPGKNGRWTEKVVHHFGGTNDGINPAAGLELDARGNLYGTTEWGGTGGTSCGYIGCGTIFELVPSRGQWTEKVLHSFGGFDGSNPFAGVILDADGRLYGTTASGGKEGSGTVFELSLNKMHVWTESLLHSFVPFSNDGITGARLTSGS